MPRSVCEIPIRGEQHEIVANAELSEQRVDRSNLDAAPAASVPQGGRSDVILAIRLEERQDSEALHDQSLCSGTREALQKLLENETCRDDDVRPEQSLFQLTDLGLESVDIATKRKRPDARIDEKVHLPRDRSVL